MPPLHAVADNSAGACLFLLRKRSYGISDLKIAHPWRCEWPTKPEIRSNIVVALGDMAFRWTNLTEPWMSHIYALLRDKDTQVRHNTLTVLTHLVLNDMVKVRGQVSEMARLSES